MYLLRDLKRKERRGSDLRGSRENLAFKPVSVHCACVSTCEHEREPGLQFVRALEQCWWVGCRLLALIICPFCISKSSVHKVDKGRFLSLRVKDRRKSPREAGLTC